MGHPRADIESERQVEKILRKYGKAEIQGIARTFGVISHSIETLVLFTTKWDILMNDVARNQVIKEINERLLPSLRIISVFLRTHHDPVNHILVNCSISAQHLAENMANKLRIRAYRSKVEMMEEIKTHTDIIIAHFGRTVKDALGDEAFSDIEKLEFASLRKAVAAGFSAVR